MIAFIEVVVLPVSGVPYSGELRPLVVGEDGGRCSASRPWLGRCSSSVELLLIKRVSE